MLATVGEGALSNVTLSQFNFGEYDARREYLRAQQYFMKSFIDPISFSLGTLSNSRNYIIVGQKGSGKSACQIYLENEKTEKEGYIADLISFYDELTAEDYRDFASTQRINFVALADITQIESSYDFRDIWRRVIFIRIARKISEINSNNRFVKFCISTTRGTNSFIDGIKKSLTVEVGIDLGVFSGSVEFDPSRINDKKEISIKYFNEIAQKLFLSECAQYRMYFFIDELVISNLNTKSDEYKARLALVRDIIKVSCALNDLCVKNGLDFHFICNLRPEVRTKLNEIDPEISKIMDGNDVFLQWDDESLIEILAHKIVNGSPLPIHIDVDEFLPETITFSANTSDFYPFLLNNSWYKPRDIVRFLKVYAKINPKHHSITEEGVKQSLNEYARVSAVELFDQISVKYSSEVIGGIKSAIKSRNYSDMNDLSVVLAPHVGMVNADKLVYDLYDVGVIGNIDKTTSNKSRFFWKHREEEEFDPNMGITIHPGLWNYFNIRHR